MNTYRTGEISIKKEKFWFIQVPGIGIGFGHIDRITTGRTADTTP